MANTRLRTKLKPARAIKERVEEVKYMLDDYELVYATDTEELGIVKPDKTVSYFASSAFETYERVDDFPDEGVPGKLYLALTYNTALEGDPENWVDYNMLYRWDPTSQGYVAIAGQGTGGPGGGPGGGGAQIRVIPYPLGRPLSFTHAVGTELIVGYTYTNSVYTEGNLTLYINDIVRKTEQITTGDHELDITNYLEPGLNTIRIRISDPEGTAAQIIYRVTGDMLAISSLFPEDTPIINSAVSVPIRITGSPSIRNVYYTLDGVDLPVEQASSNNFNKLITGLTHGLHVLEVQVEGIYNDKSGNELYRLYSNTLKLHIIFSDGVSNETIISSKFDITEILQGTQLSVDYLVYSRVNEINTVNLYIDDNLVNTLNVDHTRKYWSIRSLAPGVHTLKIVSGGTTVTKTIEILPLDIDFDIVKDDFLKLYLTAFGKTNTDLTKGEWLNSYGPPVDVQLNGLNYSSDGWIDDALRLSRQSSATIMYKPFATEVSPVGRTIELEFKTRYVLDSRIPLVTCIANNIGFEITSQRVTLKGSNVSAVANFKEDEHLKITFVISPIERAILTYINGVISGVGNYTAETTFRQLNPSDILLNPNNQSIDIYSIKVYERALNQQEVLNNYIADLPDIVEKVNLYVFNDIYDNFGNPSKDKIAQRIPVMMIESLEGKPLPESKVKPRPLVRVTLEHPFDPSKNFVRENVEIDVQGTSSLQYPVKNFKLRFDKNEKYQIEAGFIPERIFTLKADYMDSSHANNTGFMKLFDTIYSEGIPPERYDSRVRTTLYGYPIVLFYRQNPNDPWSFQGVYNFNLDKDAEDSVGLNNEKYWDEEDPESIFPLTQSFEITFNADSGAGAFQDNSLEGMISSFEPRYPEIDEFSLFEDLNITPAQMLEQTKEYLRPYTEDEEILAAIDEAIPETIFEVYDEYFSHVQEHEFIEAFRILNTKYQNLKRAITWVMENNNKNTFKTEFDHHFNRESAFKYLITTLVFGLVDNLGKNAMMNTWDGDHWYFNFYDIDTALGLENQGRNIHDYDIEIGEVGTYATADSWLWVNILRYFKTELDTIYSSLRQNVYSYENILDFLYTQQISKIAQALYNEDSFAKYIGVTTDWLWMAQGTRLAHIQRWLNLRLAFLDSKFLYQTYTDNSIAIRMNVEGYQNAYLDLTPIITQYVGVRFGNIAGGTVQQKAKAYETVRIQGPAALGDSFITNMEVWVYGADWLTTLGDITHLNPSSISIERAPKLTELVLGKPGYENNLLTQVSIGNNYYLEKVDVTNCTILGSNVGTGSTEVLDVSGAENIKEVLAHGTQLKGVSLRPGAPIETLKLPETITQLVLRDHKTLTPEGLDIAGYDNIATLRLENLPNIDVLDILDKCSNVEYVRITGIDYSFYGVDQVLNLVNKLYDAETDTFKVLGIAADNTTVDEPRIVGNIRILTPTPIDEEVVDLINKALPYATVTINYVPAHLQFVDLGDTLQLTGTTAAVLTELPIPAEANVELSLLNPVIMFSDAWKPVTSIGPNAFKTKNILKVTIPETITSIDATAFAANTYIQEVTLYNTSLPANAFKGCTALQTINIYSLDALPNSAFENCTSLTAINLSNNITTLGNAVFKGCTSLVSFTLPSSITTVGDSVFENCTNLTAPNLGTGLTYIGKSMFRGCSALANLPIALPITEVKEYGFYGALGKVGLEIPGNLVTIEANAFNNLVASPAQISVTLDTINIGANALTSTNADALYIVGPAERPATWHASWNGGSTNVLWGATETRTFHFDTQGGSEIEDITTIVLFPPTPPTKYGYDFNQWLINGEPVTLPIVPSPEDPEVITLTATWTPWVYTVKYMIPTSSSDNTPKQHGTDQLVAYGETLGATYTNYTTGSNQPSVPGLVWTGKWYGPGNIVVDENWTPTQDKYTDGLVVQLSGRLLNPAGVTYTYDSVNDVYNATQCTASSGATGSVDLVVLGEYPYNGVMKPVRNVIFTQYSDATSGYPAYGAQQSSETSLQRLRSVTIEPSSTSLSRTVMINSIKSGSYGAILSFSSFLQEIILPEGITHLPSYAFMSAGVLTNINIPSSVTSIEESAFRYCSSLTSIIIPDSVTSIERYTFQHCSNLTSITIPDSVISIGVAAFQNCSSLTSITIPDSVTSIGQDAFSSCSGLTSITIPGSVTRIGQNVFSGCSNLTSITILDGITSIGSSAFQDCSNLTSITIPDSVTSISNNAFSSCSSLTSITIPDSVTSIGQNVFSSCSSLASITIPFVGGSKGATSAGNNTLFGNIFGTGPNTGAVAVVQTHNGSTNSTFYIPASLKTVTVTGTNTNGQLFYGAFSNCSMLEEIILNDTVTTIDAQVFKGCLGATIYAKATSKPTNWNAAYNPDDCPVVWGANSVSTVFVDYNDAKYKRVFVNNEYYKGAIIGVAPESTATEIEIAYEIDGYPITEIGADAFKNTSITDVFIPANITKLITGALSGSNISSIIVDAANTIYDSRDDCNAVIETATNTLVGGCQNTVIPNSITKIGRYAFKDVYNLTSIFIPESVTTISANAFSGCDNLIIVTAHASKPAGWDTNWNPDNQPVFWGKTQEDIPEALAIPTYLVFQSDSPFTLKVYDNTKHWDGTLYYSTDLETWSVWDGTTTLSSVNNKLYLRGTGNTRITGSSNQNYRWVLTGSNIECVGNIENLLDWREPILGSHPSMASYCYYGMFYGCTSLASAPALPATTLAGYCYYRMFEGCTALASAPALPATTLADYCYWYMFSGCIALTSAPALPATTLAEGCYSNMFYGCTALVSAPALPATTLADYCYYFMFYGCTALASAPALPATTLATRCYYSMFQGCTALVSAPALPATSLSTYCYAYMFDGCTALVSAPALPATTLATRCYDSMFQGCISLKISSTQTGTYQYEWRIPTSGTGSAVAASNWGISMFSGTGGTFTSDPSINTTYYVENPPVPEPNPTYLTFQSDSPFTLKVANSTKSWNGTLYYSTDLETWSVWSGTTTLHSSDDNKLYLRGKGNTRITGNSQNYRWVLEGSNIECVGSIDSLLDYEYGTSFATKMTNDCYAHLFRGCTALVSPPALPATTLASGCYYYMFQGCTALASAPALPATTLASDCYYRMFAGCTSLTSAPALPATTLASYCYEGMFQGCTALALAPALPATTLAGGCYRSMFYGCRALTSPPALPATTLAPYCYQYMFQGCTALASAPDLPATTLAGYCYDSMFKGCTSLKISSAPTEAYLYEWRIPTSGTGTIATAWNTNMLSGTGGTFTGNPDIDTTYYVEHPPVPEPNTTYLAFQSNSPFTLQVYDNTKHWNGTLYYSTDTTTWNEWNGTTISSVDNKLYLRGTGNTVITGFSPNYRWVLEGSNIGCTGNIENLLDWEAVESGNRPSMGVYCYAHLFSDCTALTSPPKLPATTLANQCYYNMFKGCTALTSAPALPATTLADRCYDSMFRDCAALVSAPALPATTLADRCYDSMFRGCTTLVSAPALPATTLSDYCYYSMFYDCTALASPPALPATTLASGCYDHMFSGCTALASAPALPATTLADSCYHSMFSGCTTLTTPPDLPATTLADYCYAYMFEGCASLKISSTQTEAYLYEWRIPTSGTATAVSDWNLNMFSGTGGTFTGDPDINTIYYIGITYLTFQSDSPFTLKVYDNTKHWNGTLYYSTDTTTWSVWDGTTTLSSVNNKFYLRGTGNTRITGYDSQNYRWVLTGSNIECTGNIENLLDWETVASGNHPSMTVYCYAHLFRNCAALTSAPKLPAITLTGNCYQSMFEGCTALTSAPALPATTLVMGCYIDMFRDCKALTSVPALPATTLATSCYARMFQGCTSLKISSDQTETYQYAWRIPTSGTGTTASNWNSNMFSGTGGSFTGNPDIDTTYYVENPPVV